MKRFAILLVFLRRLGDCIPRALWALPLLAACNTGEKKVDPIAAPAPTVKEKKAETFGVAVTEPITPLASIAKDPAAFKGKTIATSGKVTKVCTHQGCWMAIGVDGDKSAMVRMHGHSFFVPPNESTVGRTARVQGNVVLMKDGKECEGMDQAGAELELDATGVELDPIS